MKNREKTNLRLAKSLASMKGNSNFYTPEQIKSEGIPECTVEWKGIPKTIIGLIATFKSLITSFKGWRGSSEHTAYIQVCE